MAADPDGHRDVYTPFFPNSINLISACSNSGKSTLLLNFIKNRQNCFIRPFDRVVVVLCNDTVSGESFRELASGGPLLTVEVCFLKEFVPQQILLENDLLIFEDVYALSSRLSESINVLAHHLNLNSVFLVTQSILVDKSFKKLLSLAHRVILFFSGSQATHVSNHLKKYYFVNSEIKDYFKEIISYGEKTESVGLIELNDVNGRFRTKYFAILNFDVFFDSAESESESEESEPEKSKVGDFEIQPTLVFPKMSRSRYFESEFSDNSASIPEGSEELPKGSFVLVPAKNVTKRKSAKQLAREKKDGRREDETDKEKIWKRMDESVQESIETGLRYKNQQPAKNIAKSILGSKYFSVSTDGRTLRINEDPDKLKSKSKSKKPKIPKSVSLLDYLNAASRPGGPRETFEPIFYQITKLLVLSKTPKFYIRNKNLFNPPSSRQNSISKKKFNQPPQHHQQQHAPSHFDRRF